MHTPVLLQEVLAGLDPQSNENFIDATFGAGGHSFALLEKNKPKGKVLGIEIDQGIYQNVSLNILDKDLKKRLVLINDSYCNLEKIINENNFQPIHGILFDFGVCSWHLEQSGKGFSFLKDEPLDMRFDFKNSLTAEEIVNNWSEKDIEEILKNYSQERYAQRISLAIIRERKYKRITSTFDLINILKKTLLRNYENRRIHFATRTFQALRIAVNDELNNIENTLKEAINLVSVNGKIAAISFHSLEDRIIKNIFRDATRSQTVKFYNKKPIIPSKDEIIKNPRSRSAKLRIIIKK